MSSNNHEPNIFKKEDVYKVLYHIYQHCTEEKVDYLDTFKLLALSGTNIIPSEKFSTALEELLGSSAYILTSHDLKLIEHFYCSQNSKTKIFIEYQPLCKDLDKFNRISRFLDPMFKQLKENLVKEGIVFETYLKKLFKPSLKSSDILPEKLNNDILNRMLHDNEFQVDDVGTVSKVIIFISKGAETTSITSKVLIDRYVEITGDNETEAQLKAQKLSVQKLVRVDNNLTLRMEKGQQSWAHLHLVGLAHALKTKQHDSVKEYMTEHKLEVDQRGYCLHEVLDKAIRQLEPGISLDDLKKFVGEFKHPDTDKYDVKGLDETIILAMELEKTVKENVDEKHIKHQKNIDMFDMLKMFTKHAIRSKKNMF